MGIEVTALWVGLVSGVFGIISGLCGFFLFMQAQLKKRAGQRPRSEKTSMPGATGAAFGRSSSPPTSSGADHGQVGESLKPRYMPYGQPGIVDPQPSHAYGAEKWPRAGDKISASVAGRHFRPFKQAWSRLEQWIEDSGEYSTALVAGGVIALVSSGLTILAGSLLVGLPIPYGDIAALEEGSTEYSVAVIVTVVLLGTFLLWVVSSASLLYRLAIVPLSRQLLKHSSSRALPAPSVAALWIAWLLAFVALVLLGVNTAT
ncbi:hypothetical protein ACI8AC_12740 [Geodermatophilus sp. SYSU D00758]